MRDCPDCDENGTIKCEECDGTGYVSQDFNVGGAIVTIFTGSFIDEVGDKECSCDDGRVECPRCGGSGEIDD